MLVQRMRVGAAHTVVGYLAAWGRAVFFADNMLVNAAFVAVGLWVRDLFEGYLPSDEKGARKLGSNPRPKTILALGGDPG